MAGQGSYRKPLLDEDGNKIATRYKRGKKEPVYYGTDVLNMGLEKLKEYKPGRQPKYPPTLEGLEMFAEGVNQYFEELNMRNNNSEMTGQIIPSKEALSIYLGISADTFDNYARQRSIEWTEYLQYVNTFIASVKIDAVNKGAAHPVWTIFDMKNNHGYRDVTTNVNIDISNKKAVLTAEELPTLGMNDNQSLPDKGEVIQTNFQEIKEPEYIPTTNYKED